MLAFSEPKFKYSSRAWRPVRIWEALYRVAQGERLLYLCKPNEIAMLSLQAQEYARRLNIDVSCSVVKMIYEDDTGRDLVSDVLIFDVKNPRADQFASGAESESNWYPIRLGEAVYRTEDGKSLLWQCDAGNDSNKLLRHAKAISSRLGVKVACKVGRMIEQRDGVDVVQRIVVMTPFGNEKAVEFARAVEAGESPDVDGSNITQEAAEGFFNPKASEPPKKRGRPPKKAVEG